MPSDQAPTQPEMVRPATAGGDPHDVQTEGQKVTLKECQLPPDDAPVATRWLEMVMDNAGCDCEEAIGYTCGVCRAREQLDALVSAISNGATWRLASDKPTSGGHVLAYDAARDHIFIVTEHFDWWGHIDPQGRKEYDAPKFTHWMPLPEAPI